MAYVKADAVAEHLGQSKQTIYRWARQGIIPSHVFGRMRLFVLEEIDEQSKRGEFKEKA